MHEQQFTHHALLVLNNFGSEGMHVKLMATMFQNMFPSINVHKVCQRHQSLDFCFIGDL
jgi:ribosome biogenesis protein SSF1/2